MAILQGARVTGSIIATQFIKASGFSGSLTASRLYVQGSVGIGTSSPSAKLTIVDNTNGGTINLVGRTSDDTAAINFRATGDASTYAYVSPDTNEFRLYHNDGFMSFYPGGSEKVRITSGGNVGIGTTSPSNKLTIVTNTQYDGYYLRNSNGVVGTMLGVGATNDDGTIGLYSSVVLKTNITANGASYFNGGNVGIGTNSPAYTLEVASGTSGQQSLVNFRTADSTTANNAGIQIFATPSATATSREAVMALDADGANASGGDYFLIKKRGNSGTTDFEQYSNASMRFGTNFISRATYDMTIANDGNVGIGTTSPLAKLQVSAGRSYFFSGDQYSVGLAQTAAQANYMYLGTATDGTFYISETGGTARVTVQQSGNVGIGTTSPVAPLDVSKLEYPSLGGVLVNFSAGTTTPTTEKYVILRQTYTGTAFDSPMLVFRANANASNQNSFGTIRITYNGSILFSNVNESSSDVSAVSEKVRIDSNGNVGIGTSSPGAKLDVNGDVYISPNTAGKNTFILSTNASNDARLLMRSDTTTKVDIQANGTSYFNGGNVGIGTTSPSAKLHVSGSSTALGGLFNGRLFVGTTTGVGQDFVSVKFNSGGTYSQAINIVDSNSSANNSAYLVLRRSDDTYMGNIRRGSTDNAIYVGGNSYLALGSGDTERVRIDSSGNVGVGTTSPTKLLHLYAGNDYASVRLQNTAADKVWDLVPSVPGVANSGFSIYNLTDTSVPFHIKNDGNVGIATTSPNSSLQVAGSATIGPYNTLYAGTGVNSLNINAASYPVLALYYGTTLAGTFTGYSDHVAINTPASKYISFEPNDSEIMRLTSAGNVGIGTSSPTQKLHVVGNVLSSYNILTSVVKISSASDAASYISVDGYTAGLSYAGTYIGLASLPGFSVSANLYIGGGFPIIPAGWSGTISGIAYANAVSLASSVLLQTSPDGTTWTTRSQTSSPSGTETLTYSVSDSATPLYVRFTLRQESGGTVAANDCNIQNIIITNLPSLPNKPSISNRFIVNDAGNVGIGTTSPTGKFDVWGGITLDSAGSTDRTLYFRNQSTSTGGTISSDQSITFKAGVSGTPSTAVTILRNSLNVGIGTTNPTEALYVLKASGDSSATFKAGSGGAEINLDATNGYAAIKIYSSGTEKWRVGQINDSNGFQIWQSGTGPRIYVNSSGNVGIGTTSPVNKLHVSGSSTNLPLKLEGLTSNATGYFLTVDNTTGVVYKSTGGANGTSGTSGANGSPGSPGSSGTNGTSGTSGANGSPGTSGTSGANGSPGSSGVTGTSGSSGSSVGGSPVRAYVYFNGTGTVAINGSDNVSSITDNGVGDYTVNFTTAFVDAYYTVAGTCTLDFTNASSLYNVGLFVPRQANAQVAGSCRLACEYYNNTLYDCVAVRAEFVRA